MAKGKTTKKTTITGDQFEGMLNEYFGKKAPQLPKNIKDIIVNIAPYLAIISVVFMIPALFGLISLGGAATMMAPMGGPEAVRTLPNMWIGIILLIPVAVLELLAIPGLFGRKAVAWKYMYWAQIVSIISSLIELNIFGAILSFLIGFYILFQIKSYYK